MTDKYLRFMGKAWQRRFDEILCNKCVNDTSDCVIYRVIDAFSHGIISCEIFYTH